MGHNAGDEDDNSEHGLPRGKGNKDRHAMTNIWTRVLGAMWWHVPHAKMKDSNDMAQIHVLAASKSIQTASALYEHYASMLIPFILHLKVKTQLDTPAS